MSPAIMDNYEPDGVRGAERLDLVAAAEHGAEVTWEDVNRSVQDVFSRLAAEVQQRWPHIRPRPGRTLTHLPLFSYCAFEVPVAPHIDPVVAAVDFIRSPTGQEWVVRADLSGEDSGQILEELPERTVLDKQEAIRAAAEDLARKLAEMAEKIHDALHRQDPAACP